MYLMFDQYCQWCTKHKSEAKFIKNVWCTFVGSEKRKNLRITISAMLRILSRSKKSDLHSTMPLIFYAILQLHSAHIVKNYIISIVDKMKLISYLCIMKDHWNVTSLITFNDKSKHLKWIHVFEIIVIFDSNRSPPPSILPSSSST